MTAESLTVAGRHFRTKADYEAALRDQKKINTIKAQTDLEDPVQLYELYGEMQSGIYRFETLVGNDFDDEIYEKIEKLKKQGITAQNAARFFPKGKAGKVKKGKKEKKPKKEKQEKAPARLLAIVTVPGLCACRITDGKMTIL